MPSTADNRLAIPAIQTSDLQTIPTWARKEYRNSQAVLAQLLEQAVKLETNIADLEEMHEKGECPRSLKVNVTINVAADQQAEMDNKLSEAKKHFESLMLQALITARKQELNKKKTEANKKTSEFQTYLTNTFRALQENNIPLPPEDEDLNISIAQYVDIYRKRTEQITHEVHTQHYFQRQKSIEREQAKRARIEERRLNQELTDPQVKQLTDRVNSLEKKLSSRNTPKPTQTQKGRPPQRKPKQQNGLQKRTKNPNRPFRNSNGTPPKRKTGKKPGTHQSGNQGRAEGNRPRRPRSTNTTNQSGSKPQNYPRPRN